MATTSLKKINQRSFDYWKAQHLLNRAGFGGQPSQVLALRDMGPEDAVDHLLDFERSGEDPIRADRDCARARPTSRPGRSGSQSGSRSETVGGPGRQACSSRGPNPHAPTRRHTDRSIDS